MTKTKIVIILTVLGLLIKDAIALLQGQGATVDSSALITAILAAVASWHSQTAAVNTAPDTPVAGPAK